MAELEDFKSVDMQKYDDSEGLKAIEQEFIESLRKCEDKIVGSERYGEQIEFFDEDGAVLLVVTVLEDEGRALFEFALTETVFSLSLDFIPDLTVSVE